MIRCCKDCQERTLEPNCHMTCRRYLDAKELHDKERKAQSDGGIVAGYYKELSLDIQEALQRPHKQQRRRKR